MRSHAMRFLVLSGLFLLIFGKVSAIKVTGTVIDEKGKILPYASILVKGTTYGTSANNEGKYFLNLESGAYSIVCQYVGYGKAEKKITLDKEAVVLDFQLFPQELNLGTVVIKPGGEDPAYEIIRKAIKKRSYYLNQLDRFRCEVYIKGQLRLRNFPKSFMGQKIDFEDGDTGKKKIVYLSETIATYSYERPGKSKVEVLSTKVSGQSDGFGFSIPQIISFYQNNIEFGRNLNPRGFISPISDNALHYYKYKFEGSFFEDGKEINKIRVIPRRKYEPLFSGYINITEGDWRIHSLQLTLTKESQMELVDTVKIEQLYVPYSKDLWVIKSQVIYPAIKLFGFDAYGSFVDVYSKFDPDPELPKKFFDKTILKFNVGSNKKPADYWDSIRPLPLMTDEAADYLKKDSLEKAHRDPHYLDSIDRIQNRITPIGILLTGQTLNKEKSRSSFSYPSLISALSYNTVEGIALDWRSSFTKRLDSTNISRKSISLTPDIRYGFHNQHLNAYADLSYNFGTKYFSSLSLSGGKRIEQFNNSGPISPFYNSISTLLYESNYMKFYEAWFGKLNFTKNIGDGFRVRAGIEFQDRMPLDNTTGYSIVQWKTRSFTPNYPNDLLGENMIRNQALMASIDIHWRLGSRYIEFPDRKVMIGSNLPAFDLLYIQGIPNAMGSDVDYAKWRFSISQQVNMKLAGQVEYRLSLGGFLYSNSVFVPDYDHFNGNQIIIASDNLNGFQLLPYYKYSNTAPLYGEAHLQYHLNGFLTNKIPLFRKLNWHLVAGASGFYIDPLRNYTEAYLGLENILKLFRVDMAWGFEEGKQTLMGLRIALPFGIGNNPNN